MPRHKQKPPFTVGCIEVAARTDPKSLQRRIRKLFRLARRCDLLVKVTVPAVAGGGTRRRRKQVII